MKEGGLCGKLYRGTKECKKLAYVKMYDGFADSGLNSIESECWKSIADITHL